MPESTTSKDVGGPSGQTQELTTTEFDHDHRGQAGGHVRCGVGSG